MDNMNPTPAYDVTALKTLEEAARVSGYCIQHLRRLCHRRKISHLRRGKSFFFTESQMAALFEIVQARTTASSSASSTTTTTTTTKK